MCFVRIRGNDMIYKGKFYFDKRSHPGECSVVDNNIHLTINESDLNGFKKKIIGNAGNRHLIIYNSRLVGNGIGYYKYQSSHLVDGLNMKYQNIDFINHIQDFRFTFLPLDEWLGFKTIVYENDGIKFDIPNDIILYDDEHLNIKIKYFKEEIQGDINMIGNLKIIPYICFQSGKVISVDKIRFYIQLATRFFATLMGFTGQVNEIKFHYSYKGKKIFETIENDLIINVNFTNFYDIRDGYPTFNLRTYYKDFNNVIEMFSIWFGLYNDKRYQEIFTYYFSPYRNRTIEDDFLTITKSLEKLSVCKENKKEKYKNNKRFQDVITKFYDNHNEELVSEMKQNNFKKEYIKNIKEIHNRIANELVYKYDYRIILSNRLNELDSSKILNKHFKASHIDNLKNKNLSIYDCLANTRNYYTHLGSNDNTVKIRFLSGYCRLLDKILIKEFLTLICNDIKQVSKIIDKDQYLNLYNNRE